MAMRERVFLLVCLSALSGLVSAQSAEEQLIGTWAAEISWVHWNFTFNSDRTCSIRIGEKESTEEGIYWAAGSKLIIQSSYVSSSSGVSGISSSGLNSVDEAVLSSALHGKLLIEFHVSTDGRTLILEMWDRTRGLAVPFDRVQ
jgi:hypothetical protein